MKNIFLFMMLILSISFCTNAEDINTSKIEMNKCKEVSDSTKRLACFDEFFGEKEKVTPEVKGAWILDEKISPIDDSKNITIILQADEPIVTSLLGKENPALVIRCSEKRTELYISWGAYLGLDDAQVISRLDTDKAQTKRWSISTNNKSTFYSGKTIDFIKQLLSKRKLFVKVTPYGESPVSTSFNLDGMNEVIKPLREACKW